MRILLTGASGFIGTPVLEKLISEDHQILALSRSIGPKKKKNLFWHKCNLSLQDSYSKEVEVFLPEVLIHLAWQDIPNFSLETCKANLVQSLTLISFIVDLNSCKKIIVSGSCFEFNQLQGECLEDSVSEVYDHFTWAKNSLYLWLIMMSKNRGFHLLWLRMFYVYGPRQRSGSLIPSILENLNRGMLPEINTPRSAHDFIFIDDVASAFLKAISVKNDVINYNLGSGSSSSILEVCRISEQIVLGTSSLTEEIIIRSKDKNCDINFWAEISNAKKYLDWNPKTSLEDGIKKTWDLMKLK